MMASGRFSVILLLTFYLLLLECRGTSSSLGLLFSTQRLDQPVCVLIDDATMRTLGTNPKTAEVYTLKQMGRADGCQALPTAGVKGKMVSELSNVCGLQRQADLAQSAGAAGLLVVARPNFSVFPIRLGVRQRAPNRPFPVAVISPGAYSRLLNLSLPRRDDLPIVLTQVGGRRGYLTILLFHLIALTCLLSGMWLSIYGLNGVKYGHVYGAEHSRSSSYQPAKVSRQSESGSEQCKQLPNVIVVVLLLAFAVGTLCLLYFFYDAVVWVLVVNMMLIMAICFKSQLMEIICRLPFIPDINPIKFEGKYTRFWIGPEIDKRSIIIFPFCCIPSIMWLVYRTDMDKVWIIQDICGIVACSCIIKTVRFGSLKIITLLGFIFFLYDIFMVYITPLFMAPRHEPLLSNFTQPMWTNSSTLTRVKRASGGQSVMESVATGSAGKSGVKLPILFMLPNLNFGGEELQPPCLKRGFALLGFGDIIVPGFLVAFSFFCDTKLQHLRLRRCRYLYSSITLIGYHLGLFLIYVIMFVMQTGQPALFTIIPCSLIPFMVAALVRGDFQIVWTGIFSPRAELEPPDESLPEDDESVDAPAPPRNPGN